MLDTNCRAVCRVGRPLDHSGQVARALEKLACPFDHFGALLRNLGRNIENVHALIVTHVGGCEPFAVGTQGNR
jgi:hypothetical protein